MAPIGARKFFAGGVDIFLCLFVAKSGWPSRVAFSGGVPTLPACPIG